MNALFAALIVATASLPSTRITAGAKVEARASSLVGATGHGGVEATPEVLLHGRYGRAYVDMNYAPRLMLAYPTGVNPFHAGELAVAFSPREEHQLSVEQQLAYGYSDFAYRVPAELTERELRTALSPRPRAIGDYLDSNTDVTYWARLGERISGSLSVGYNMSGGRSLASQVDVPFQRTPYAGVKATAVASEIDTLTSTANFERTELTNTNVFSVMRFAEEWQRLLRDDTRLILGAGVAAMRTNLEPYQPFPLARVGALHDVGFGRRRVTLAAFGRMTPWVNPLTGLLVRRGELLGSAQLKVTEELQFRAFGGGGWALFASRFERERALMFGGDASLRVAHDFHLYSGAVVQNQLHPAYPELPRVHWTVSGGVRWQLDDRFGAHF